MFTPPCGLLKGYAPRFSGLHALRQRGVALLQTERESNELQNRISKRLRRFTNTAGMVLERVDSRLANCVTLLPITVHRLGEDMAFGYEEELKAEIARLRDALDEQTGRAAWHYECLTKCEETVIQRDAEIARLRRTHD